MENEMEITPEMIEAGVSTLEYHSGSFANVQLVEAVYTAMRELEPGQILRAPRAELHRAR